MISEPLKLNDKIIEKTDFWAPPVPDWKPLKKKKSSLRMACIVEERLYQGLRFEAEVLSLTPSNYKSIIQYGGVDFLLMESIWVSSCGNWHIGQGREGTHYDLLKEILNEAKKRSIPTVFWMTKGHEYHDIYKHLSRQFDVIFCADPVEMEIMKNEGILSHLLSPCIQPAIYNPFRYVDHYNRFEINVLFDGWADLVRLRDNISLLEEIQKFDLSIIESRYRIFINRRTDFPEYRDSILGCTTRQARVSALKYAKTYLTFDHSLSTRTEQQWMSLEAIGCRLAVIHNGKLSNGDIRKHMVREWPDPVELLVELTRFEDDELYQERIAHKGWRTVHQSHTFSNRIKRICETLDIDYLWDEFPKISVITPTNRSKNLKHCLETFENQSYPNRELIIVFNGNQLPPLKGTGLDQPMDTVKITHVPSDLFAGACLNMGHSMATGEYCFRMDDDDQYGPNYILDMMLNANALDLELFGKPPVPLYFEDDQTLYLRKNSMPFCVVPFGSPSQNDIWMGGNSISGRRQFFNHIQYDDWTLEAADSSLMYQLPAAGNGLYALTDRLNLVAQRRQDQTTHTWKIDEALFKKGDTLDNVTDLMI